MDRLQTMAVFSRVIETASFSAVAREFGTTQPTISKQVAALEHRLGTRLLHRTSRRVTPTEIGRAFYERCRRILSDIDAAEGQVTELQEAPSGLLRVGTPVAFGRLHILPLIPFFLARHPRLRLELSMNDRSVDLVEEGVDVTIRVGRVSELSLVARHLGTARRLIVATPEYWRARGVPRHPADLADHNCIVYTYLSTVDEWHFDGPEGALAVRVDGNFRANNSEAIRHAVLAGLGVANAPTWLIEDELRSGAVQPVLLDFRPTSLEISALYPQTRHLAGKVRTFIDFLLDEYQRSGKFV